MRKPFNKKIKFYFGFPVEEEGESGQKEGKRQSGVAMLIALLVTAMVMLFLTELKLSSAVALRLSLGNHLNTKGEYVAKSGANLAAFLISSDLAIELTIFETAPGTQLPPIWDQINGFPIGAETQEMISTFQEGFNLSSISDSGALDQLKDLEGSFVLNIEDETAKINLNYCAVGRGTKCLEMLEALFSCPAEREFLERKKVIAKDIVMMVRDYIDNDDRPISGTGYTPNYSAEEDPYLDLDQSDLKGPKNARFDSIDEMRLIPGWDEELHKIFSPYFTVYPNPPSSAKESELLVNFNNVSRELLGCLLPKSTRDCDNSAISYNNRIDTGPITGFGNIQSTISQNYCTPDTNKAKLFTYRTDVFRVNVQATVEEQTRDLSVVMKRGIPDEIDQRDQFTGAYKYLYWKML